MIPQFQGMGKYLIIAGILLIAVGSLIHFAGRVPLLGKLPGDISIKKQNFSFYFPLATSIILSIIISLILFVIRKLS